MSDHVYLSTACLHELHDYCASSEGQDGEKIPKRCKWCPSICVCPCGHGVAEPKISDEQKRGAARSPMTFSWTTYATPATRRAPRARRARIVARELASPQLLLIFGLGVNPMASNSDPPPKDPPPRHVPKEAPPPSRPPAQPKPSTGPGR